MSRGQWPYALGIGLLAMAFTWVNRGERMALHLGPFTWYRAPVGPVVLGAFLLGMAAMILVSLGQDRGPPPPPDF